MKDINWEQISYMTKDKCFVNADEMVFIYNRETRDVRKGILPPFISNKDLIDVPFKYFVNMMYFRDNIDDKNHSINKDLNPRWIK